MITLNKAWELIDESVQPLRAQTVWVVDALGLVLAEDVVAPINLPPFDNSAVDGFALRREDIEMSRLDSSVALKIGETIAAGDLRTLSLQPHTTMRIMTGAPLMPGADAVVMQEHVRVESGLSYFSVPTSLSNNIRFAGEDVRMGEQVAKRGDVISAATIGLLCALGIAEVRVYPRPRVAILSTGSELVTPGDPLAPGQVYYCTGPMLAALVREWGGKVVSMERVEDSLDATIDKVRDGLNVDLLLVVGGMSVGQYDFARQAFDALAVKQVFFQGKWRPGKPLYFGQWESRPVVGIPGNPVACFVMAHIFVKRCLYAMMGKSPELDWREATLASEYTKKPGFAFFARAIIDERGEANILPGQGSHELGSLAKANAMCWFDEDGERFASGEKIRYLAL
jgi:molybdopterin molybdotransferase